MTLSTAVVVQTIIKHIFLRIAFSLHVARYNDCINKIRCVFAAVWSLWRYFRAKLGGKVSAYIRVIINVIKSTYQRIRPCIIQRARGSHSQVPSAREEHMTVTQVQ